MRRWNGCERNRKRVVGDGFLIMWLEWYTWARGQWGAGCVTVARGEKVLDNVLFYFGICDINWPIFVSERIAKKLNVAN